MNLDLLNYASPTGCDSTSLVSKINVDKAKFNQLNCRPVGDGELINTPFLKNDGTQGNLDQNYFRGLVYRYDSRNISVIKDAGGFYPRVPRDDKNHRLLAWEVIKGTGLFGLTYVVSDQCTGVIATSKSISCTNGSNWLTEDEKKYKYMIDTKVINVRGLDPDHFRKMDDCESYEVCFEDPLPYNSIVGYFKDQNYKEFYLNNEYQGGFSWTADDVVHHYQNHPSQYHAPVENTESLSTVQ